MSLLRGRVRTLIREPWTTTSLSTKDQTKALMPSNTKELQVNLPFILRHLHRSLKSTTSVKPAMYHLPTCKGATIHTTRFWIKKQLRQSSIRRRRWMLTLRVALLFKRPKQSMIHTRSQWAVTKILLRTKKRKMASMKISKITISLKKTNPWKNTFNILIWKTTMTMIKTSRLIQTKIVSRRTTIHQGKTMRSSLHNRSLCPRMR